MPEALALLVCIVAGCRTKGVVLMNFVLSFFAFFFSISLFVVFHSHKIYCFDSAWQVYNVKRVRISLILHEALSFSRQAQATTM